MYILLWYQAVQIHWRKHLTMYICGILSITIDDWDKYLDITEEEWILNRIRECTSTDRPAGDETFATRLEELLGRTLRPKTIGRPRK